MTESIIKDAELQAPTLALWRSVWICVLTLGAAVPIAFPIAYAVGMGGFRHSYWRYIAGLADITYFDTGFARRELEGTLIRLFTSEPMAGTFWFHLVTYAALTTLGIWVCCRGAMTWSRRLVLGVVLTVILERIAIYVGSTDAVVMACGLLGALAVKDARWIAAASLAFVALLFHETGLLVLGPLLAAVAIATGSWRQWKNRSALLGLLILSAALGCYILGFGMKADLHVIGRRVHAQFDSPISADVAVYMNLTGVRGMVTAICSMHRDPAYPLKVASGLLVCVPIVVGLNQSRRWLALGCAVPTYLGLSMIATDIGRWATFAVFCGFAFNAIAGDERASLGPRAAVAVLAATALMSIGLDFTSSSFAPIPLLYDYAQSHGLRSPEPVVNVTACDPGWRASIGLE